MVAKSKANELRVVRLYHAPLKTVWQAWVDPLQVAKWWGPRGFTLTTTSRDVRPGGTWIFTMHGPDGVDYPNKVLFLEVDAYKRLVYDHGANDDQPPMFRVTVVFREVKDGTEMEMIMTLPTAEAAAETRKFVKKANGETTWDRLAEFLIKESAGREQFVINRSFAAPIGLVYEMWTDPKHLAKWMGPTGSTTEFLRADIRAGGSSVYKMVTSGMGLLYGRAQYLELSRPHRVVYTQQFVDAQEMVIRHPMAKSWPETMLTTITLAAEADDQTRVTIVWEPHGKVTAEELQTFVAARTSMTGGWSGSFDALDQYLSGSRNWR